MTHEQRPAQLVDRLRNNLHTLGIAANDDDVNGMIDKGFLARVQAFERSLAAVPNDALPDMHGGSAPPTNEAPLAQPYAAYSHSDETDDSVPFVSLRGAAALLQRGQVSPMELTERALSHINAHNDSLNVFQQIFADAALSEARRATYSPRPDLDEKPLWGVPVAVKDLVAVKGIVQSAGSKILAEQVATADATATARLRAAGAIIIGKTRMSEFAYSPGSNNGHYGPTANPWNTAHDSGGSSSGSAVAVASGMAYAALGSDTGGSIRIPASLCGVVGLKPTFGRCSLHGVTPLSWSLDHMGPLTRSVEDAALLLSILSGDDGHDGRTRNVPQFAPQTLHSDVRGLRIGVLTDDGGAAALATDATLATWRTALDALAAQGAQLIPIAMREIEPLRWASGAILALEAATYHLPWLQTRLDEYGDFMRQRILSSFAYAPDAYLRAQQARAQLRARCAAVFEQVDLISTPSQPDTAPRLGVPASVMLTNPFNVLGWPAISVPAGLAENGLPVGLQLVGKPWDEATVLRAALALEQALALSLQPPI